MSKIKHIETRIISVFGLEDDDGNIIQQFVAQADPKRHDDPMVIRRLKHEDFGNACQAVLLIRSELEAKVSELPPPAPAG